MNFVERVMRVMTHINIGSALGLAAWMPWSGWQVVTGHIAPAYTPSEIRTLVHWTHAGRTTPIERVPVHERGGSTPRCDVPMPPVREAFDRQGRLRLAVRHEQDGVSLAADVARLLRERP